MHFRFTSLFDYAVRELGYSEAAASRRIQTMRLMTEIPEMTPKVESGTLSLSNICQAQSFFRDLKKAQPEMAFSKEQKMVSAEHTEVRFLIDQQLRESLDQVRALLGPKGAGMSLSELVAEMARLSAERLSEKRFGKTRVRAEREAPVTNPGAGEDTPESKSDAAEPRKRTRYISKAVKHQVWRTAGGKCTACGSKHRLQFDHIQPFALRGDSSSENIQLLCSSCNLRRGIQSFGTQSMRRGRFAPKIPCNARARSASSRRGASGRSFG